MKKHFWKTLIPAMLLSGLVCLALAGCGKTPPTAAQVRAQWMEKTRQVIKDPARAAQIADLVGRLLDAQEAKAAALQSATDRLAAANADYHVSPEQLRTIYQEYEDRQREALLKFKDDVFALRRQVSAAEWEAMAD